MPEPLVAADHARAAQGPDLAELATCGAVRPILTYPDPVLRRVCTPAGQMIFARLQQLAADLLATMYHAGGRGLAAPQIGEPWRIFAMDPGCKAGTPCPRIVIDPEILPIGTDTDMLEEGCLSIPGQPVLVTRPAQISMRCFSLTGELLLLPLSGIEARIAQHENDHLDGRLIVDFS